MRSHPKPDADEKQGSQRMEHRYLWSIQHKMTTFIWELPHLTVEMDWRWRHDLNWARFLMLLQRILLVSMGLSLGWRSCKHSCYGAIHHMYGEATNEVEKKCHLGCWWLPVFRKSWVAFDPKLILLFATKRNLTNVYQSAGTVLKRASVFQAQNELSEQVCAFSSTCQVVISGAVRTRWDSNS